MSSRWNPQYANNDRNYFISKKERMVDFEKFIRRYESKSIVDLSIEINILSFL